MKIITLCILLYFSILNITNAIPLPALVIWYEFIIFAIPSIIAFFSLIIFYFRKYLCSINAVLFILSILLYIYHFNSTNYILYSKHEYYLFIPAFVLLIISFKIKILRYLFLLIVVSFNFFLTKIDYNLYELKTIYGTFEKDQEDHINIQKTVYTDNYVLIYWLDNMRNVKAYTVILNVPLKYEAHLNKNKFSIIFWWDAMLWKSMAYRAYNSIKD